MKLFAHDQVSVWLEKLAEKTATPGGGSAAAMAGAMGAALNSMVIRFTIPKASPSRRSRLRIMLRHSERLRLRLLDLVDRDSLAYERMRQAYTRKRGIQAAVRHAAEVPLATATASWEGFMLARDLVVMGNQNLLSDAVAAALLSHAAILGGCGNVLINLAALQSADLRGRLRRRTKQLIRISQATTIRLLHMAWKRLGS